MKSSISGTGGVSVSAGREPRQVFTAGADPSGLTRGGGSGRTWTQQKLYLLWLWGLLLLRVAPGPSDGT